LEKLWYGWGGENPHQNIRFHGYEREGGKKRKLNPGPSREGGEGRGTQKSKPQKGRSTKDGSEPTWGKKGFDQKGRERSFWGEKCRGNKVSLGKREGREGLN